MNANDRDKPYMYMYIENSHSKHLTEPIKLLILKVYRNYNKLPSFNTHTHTHTHTHTLQCTYFVLGDRLGQFECVDVWEQREHGTGPLLGVHRMALRWEGGRECMRKGRGGKGGEGEGEMMKEEYREQ